MTRKKDKENFGALSLALLLITMSSHRSSVELFSFLAHTFSSFAGARFYDV